MCRTSVAVVEGKVVGRRKKAGKRRIPMYLTIRGLCVKEIGCESLSRFQMTFDVRGRVKFWLELLSRSGYRGREV